MALDRFDKNMSIVSMLDDEPNDVGGLTAEELKAKFDEGGAALKTYLNEVLLPQLEKLGVESITRGGNGVSYIRLSADNVLEVSADGKEYEAIRSSGHLIIDADGNAMPQRGRLQFPDGSVEDIAGVTVVKSIGGIPAGEKGAPNGVAALDETGRVPVGQLPEKMAPADHADTHKQGGSDPITPDNIGALSKTGDNTMTGALYLGSGYSRLISTKDLLQFEARGVIGDTKSRRVLVINNPIATTNLVKALTINNYDADGAGKAYNIYGEHNKPYGTYTGNGSTAERTIATGGLGGVVVLWCDTYVGFVFSGHGVFFGSGNTYSNYVTTDIKYAGGSGTITMTDKSDRFNGSGVEYHYLVI